MRRVLASDGRAVISIWQALTQKTVHEFWRRNATNAIPRAGTMTTRTPTPPNPPIPIPFLQNRSSYLSFRIAIIEAGNRIGSDTSASAPSFSVKPYFPFAFSQASITAISFSCAVMMSCASFLTSVSLPLARSTLAISTAS